jgi:hypothetical protein
MSSTDSKQDRHIVLTERRSMRLISQRSGSSIVPVCGCKGRCLWEVISNSPFRPRKGKVKATSPSPGAGDREVEGYNLHVVVSMTGYCQLWLF